MKPNRFNSELSTSPVLISRAKNRAFKNLVYNTGLYGQDDARSVMSKFRYLKWFRIELNSKNRLGSIIKIELKQLTMKKPEHKTYTFFETAWIFKWKFWAVLAWAVLAYLIIVELDVIRILIGN